jgi:hypothetical protein
MGWMKWTESLATSPHEGKGPWHSRTGVDPIEKGLDLVSRKIRLAKEIPNSKAMGEAIKSYVFCAFNF